MRLHNVLRGFIFTGFDDYLSKAIEPHKVIKQVLVHPQHGKEFYRRQQVNADEESIKAHHHSSINNYMAYKQHLITQHSVGCLKKEIVPGVTLETLIGPHLDDRHLSVNDGKTAYLPHFHRIYTQGLLGKRTGIGQQIVDFDYTHFPQRLYERGYFLVKDYQTIQNSLFEGGNPVKALRDMPPEIQRWIMDLDEKQEATVAHYIKNTLFNPAFTLTGTNNITPQGSTKYVTWECCVAVINLPNNQCIIKSVYPTNQVYREAIEHGWDGRVSIDTFSKQMKRSDM